MERQTVLIVDDSELNRMMLMEILGEQYHYIEAQNGREAVRLMEKKLTVDLMLLDINMPEMNGFQVLEQMNRFRWIDEIPVIMISTDETNQAIQQAYAMGVYGLYPPPLRHLYRAPPRGKYPEALCQPEAADVSGFRPDPGKRGKQQPDGGNSQSCGGVPQP